jgi:hypothetical protein
VKLLLQQRQNGARWHGADVLTGVSQKECVAYMLDTVTGACSPIVKASTVRPAESADTGEATSIRYHHPWQWSTLWHLFTQSIKLKMNPAV